MSSSGPLLPCHPRLPLIWVGLGAVFLAACPAIADDWEEQRETQRTEARLEQIERDVSRLEFEARLEHQREDFERKHGDPYQKTP